jgi:hypothetical protein
LSERWPRSRAELARDEALVLLRILKRCRVLAGVDQRAHEADGVSRAHRVGLGERSPGSNRSAILPDFFRVARDSLECVRVTVGEACALALHPFLEFRQVTEMEAVQERASEFSHRTGSVISLERRDEVLDVAVDNVRVEAHWIYAREHILGHRASERIQQLIEGMPSARLRRLRPEQSQQLVTAAPGFPCNGQYAEQRESAAVMTVRAEYGLATRAQKGERAERPQVIRGARQR